MATKEFYHDLDLVKVSQLLNVRVHNVTTAERTTLAGTLGAGNKGLQVFDTDLNQTYYWTGSTFTSGTSVPAGSMVYQGTHTSLTTAPASPEIGYTYVFTGTAGTLTWAGQTFLPDANISPQDVLIYRGSNTWDILEGDDDYATTTTEGNIRIATQAEVNAGTVTDEAVTPETLTGFVAARALAKTYFSSAVSTTANTPLTVTHNLNLQNKDAFTISVKNSSGSEVSVDVDSVDVNSLTITTAVALTNLKVIVIGF